MAGSTGEGCDRMFSMSNGASARIFSREAVRLWLKVVLEGKVRELASEILGVDLDAQAAARSRHDQLTKPPGSLGALEQVGIRLAGLAPPCPPPPPLPAPVI